MSEQVKHTSFWELLKTKSIEIPIIQRDYAQGRKDVKTIQIRDNFLDAIINAIKEPHSKSINLDFVYGSTEGQTLVPLDGQQRLTTLFLLHWYLAVKGGLINDEEVRGRLQRFTYKTRISSRDFCCALVDKGGIVDNSRESISEQIKDSSWFFRSWSKDPTVASMLVMLDAIHERFCNGKCEDNSNYSQYWQILSEGLLAEQMPISFYFLPLNDFKLTDELYVKMNARGKALTDFENFKAWFEQHLEILEVGSEAINSWSHKLDKEWTDLFWKYKDGENYLVDEEFMRFFNGAALTHYIEEFKGSLDDETFRKNISFFASNQYVPLSKYAELQCFDKGYFGLVSKILDNLKEGRNEEIERLLKEKDIQFFTTGKYIFEAAISGGITYPDRVRFYALTQFIIHCDEAPSLTKLYQWMRVIRNLTENSTIDSPETFARAIKSVSKLAKACTNIYEYLQEEQNPVDGFLNAQIKEERLKARLIIKDSQWEDELIDAENHSLFKGSIGFLFPAKEECSIVTFTMRKDVAKEIFNKSGINQKYWEEDSLFTRAFLAKCRKPELPFELKTNAENWKNLLRRGFAKTAIVALIDDLLIVPKEEMKEKLKNICCSFDDDSTLWKYSLVKYPELLNTSHEKIVRDYYGQGIFLYHNKRWNKYENNNILLSNYRNQIISKLLKEEVVLEENPWCNIEEKFFRGLDIRLSKRISGHIVDKIIYRFKRNTLIFNEDNNESLSFSDVKDEAGVDDFIKKIKEKEKELLN